MKVEIKAFENGPLVLTGRMVYPDLNGEQKTTSGGTVALCRCGQTARGLLCDGSHQHTRFRAAAGSAVVEPAENNSRKEVE